MAKPPKPSLQFEPLAELGRKYAAHEQALIKQVLEEWNPILRQKLKPRVLRIICKYLLDHPYRIPGQYGPYIYLILQHWLTKTETPKERPYGGREIAALVDVIMETEKISHREAYQKVVEQEAAASRRRTFDSVRRNHERYGKVKPKKSR